MEGTGIVSKVTNAFPSLHSIIRLLSLSFGISIVLLSNDTFCLSLSDGFSMIPSVSSSSSTRLDAQSPLELAVHVCSATCLPLCSLTLQALPLPVTFHSSPLTCIHENLVVSNSFGADYVARSLFQNRVRLLLFKPSHFALYFFSSLSTSYYCISLAIHDSCFPLYFPPSSPLPFFISNALSYVCLPPSPLFITYSL